MSAPPSPPSCCPPSSCSLSSPRVPGPNLVYKLLGKAAWEEAVASGAFRGAGIDLKDGYIHLSTASQVGATAQRYFHNAVDLLLLEIDAAALGDALRYEASRDGARFPHLYGALPILAVRQAWLLTNDDAGAPCIPELSGDDRTV